MRTTTEIIKRIQEDKEDLLGFRAEALMRFLSFEDAKPLLKSDATPEKWGSAEPLTEVAVLNEMCGYMEFAWSKVRNHRGISASRSIEKMAAWLWLLGDEELATFINEDQNYPQYGAPALAAVCSKYGFPIPDDPGLARMIVGQPCQPECDEGCGR